MARVILVNPSISPVGRCFITPRWMFVIAGATPTRLVGNPVIVDECIERFDPDIVERGDIVGIGITTDTCVPGYSVLRKAKAKGARVIVGGIHATLLPDEPAEMGADAVVMGNGDLVWATVVQDALAGRLQPKYDGGRLAGERLLKARWDLLDPRKYILASIQTVIGCPEACSFCSVWIADGRRPRLYPAAKVIEEANTLHRMGFRCIVFADDNFSPSTRARIDRQPAGEIRKALETLREQRLRFFEEYGRSVPENLYAVTQLTADVASDEEYLSSMYHNMRIRGVLLGVESFAPEGLKSANKRWNPAGRQMGEAVRHIQESGIFVCSSIITGLPSDTLAAVESGRDLLQESTSAVAHFPMFQVYPGTRDYLEMLADHRNRGEAGYRPRHTIEIRSERFWLDPQPPELMIRHPNLTSDQLATAVRRNWAVFYSLTRSWSRAKAPFWKKWGVFARVAYCVAGLAFKASFGGHGLSLESAANRRTALARRLFMQLLIRLVHAEEGRADTR